MAKNNSDITDRRRETVARLRLRGMTQREIASAIGDLGILNPQTGRPFSQVTINNDLAVLREEWQQTAVQEIGQHFALQLARLRELYRLAMRDDNFNLALRVLSKEMELIGTPRLVQAQANILEEAVADIRAGKIKFEPLAEEVGTDLARDLFQRAGMVIIEEGG